MREHLVGRTPRLTAYFCGIALGLALLVAGLEATRLLLIGELSGTVATAVTVIGVVGAVLLSFVAGYLNGSLLASWAAGVVPVAGRLGAPLIEGTRRELGLALVGAVGAGILLGTVGFVLAVEKHRYDARTAELPDPASRTELLELVAGSVLLGVSLAAIPLYL